MRVLLKPPSRYGLWNGGVRVVSNMTDDSDWSRSPKQPQDLGNPRSGVTTLGTNRGKPGRSTSMTSTSQDLYAWLVPEATRVLNYINTGTWLQVLKTICCGNTFTKNDSVACWSARMWTLSSKGECGGEVPLKGRSYTQSIEGRSGRRKIFPYLRKVTSFWWTDISAIVRYKNMIF